MTATKKLSVGGRSGGTAIRSGGGRGRAVEAHQTQEFMYLPLDPKKRKIRKTKTKMTEWGRRKTENGVMERRIRYEKKKSTCP